MSTPQPEAPRPLDDSDIARLQQQLDYLPEPLQPLDVSALDGFLCGVLLQPDADNDDRLMRWVLDVEGRVPPAGCDVASLRTLVLRRKAQLSAAIRARQSVLARGGRAVKSWQAWGSGIAAIMRKHGAVEIVAGLIPVHPAIERVAEFPFEARVVHRSLRRCAEADAQHAEAVAHIETGAVG